MDSKISIVAPKGDSLTMALLFEDEPNTHSTHQAELAAIDLKKELVEFLAHLADPPEGTPIMAPEELRRRARLPANTERDYHLDLPAQPALREVARSSGAPSDNSVVDRPLPRSFKQPPPPRAAAPILTPAFARAHH